MRICFITPYYPPNIKGGMEISLSLLAEELAKDHKVYVFTPNYGGKNQVEGENPTIFRLTFPPDSVFLRTNPVSERVFVKGILSLKKKWKKFDVIDAYNWFHPAKILSRKLNVPYVASIRDSSCVCDFRVDSKPQVYPPMMYFKKRFGTYGISPRQLINAVYGFILTRTTVSSIKKAACVFCASQALSVLVKNLNPCIRIVKSVALGHFEEENIKVTGVDFKKDKVIVYAGRLSEGKGAFFLYKVASKIKEKNIKFVFVGDGQLRPKESLNGNILFLGRRSRGFVLSLLKKARIAIVPSLVFEGFPRLAIESISLGTPVIGTKIGGIPEAIGKAGIIINPKEEELKNAILKFCSDEEFYKRKKDETLKERLVYESSRVAKLVVSNYINLLKK